MVKCLCLGLMGLLLSGCEASEWSVEADAVQTLPLVGRIVSPGTNGTECFVYRLPRMMEVDCYITVCSGGANSMVCPP